MGEGAMRVRTTAAPAAGGMAEIAVTADIAEIAVTAEMAELRRRPLRPERVLERPSPAGSRGVIGLDPGFRTGVKVAAVSRTGAVVDTDAWFLHQPDRFAIALVALVNKHRAVSSSSSPPKFEIREREPPTVMPLGSSSFGAIQMTLHFHRFNRSSSRHMWRF